MLPGTTEWAPVRDLFPSLSGVRQIVVAQIERVRASCGMAVPHLEYLGERDNLNQWAEAKGEAELAAYRQQKNRHSIDGLVATLGQEER